jgi:hypothetical protein
MTKNFEFRHQASLSQQLAHNDNIYTKLAGSNPELSKSIGVLLVLCEKKILNENDPNVELLLALLDVQRKAEFATSEKTNEISKMGMQMPKADAVYYDE